MGMTPKILQLKFYIAREPKIWHPTKDGIILSEHTIYRTLKKENLIKKYKRHKKKNLKSYSMPYPKDQNPN